jgi:RimJ/RimL family protein N-acetyltransferase
MAFPERAETARLLLRRPRERDRGAWLGIWGDPAVWRALRPDRGPDPAFALARFDHHLEHWARHGFGLWLVEERATRTIAGWTGPAHPSFVPELAGEVEIGWTYRRPYWGRGLAFEAASAATAAAFAQLPVERVIALLESTNSRSQRVAARLGMRRSTTVEHPEAMVQLEVYELSRDAAAAPPGARSGA